MSNSGKPDWSASGAFPFMPFPIPGLGPATREPTLSSGIDLLKSMWGNLPGSSQVPGFLVPTIDVEELDKRIGDLRAAESWVEVNLNMLRATIQGLEVQRNTIAALKAMSISPPKPAPAKAPSWEAAAPAPVPAPAPVASAPVAPEPEEPTLPSVAPGLDAGHWLSYMQDQFAKVAQAALATTGSPPAVAGKAKARPAASANARPRKARAPKR